MSKTRTLSGGITTPFNDCGLRSPVAVTKVTSRIAESSAGFDTTTCSMLPSPVKPSARYHSSDGDDAHNATASPARCTMRCSTLTADPCVSMIAETKEEPLFTSASTSIVVRGCTANRWRVAAPSTTKRVIVPPTGFSPALLMMKRPEIDSSFPGTPGQNQVDASAAGCNNGAALRSSIAAGVASTVRRCIDTMPTTLATTIAATSH